jgi:hypothetical protein
VIDGEGGDGLQVGLQRSELVGIFDLPDHPYRADVDAQELLGERKRAPHIGNLRLRTAHEDALVLEAQLEDAGGALLPEDLLFLHEAGFERGVCAADGRVPGERQLVLGREDAQAIVRLRRG